MTKSDDSNITEIVDHLFRGEAGKMTAILTRIFGFDHAGLVEDMVQDTFIANPDIRQRLIDNGPQPESVMDELFLDHEIKDSQMRILFACCQPDLSAQKQIALTLKTISGFSNAEIARALLMREPAVKKMIYRARKSIQDEELAFTVPFVSEMEERLASVRTVCYLMFNEGYKRSEG